MAKNTAAPRVPGETGPAFVGEESPAPVALVGAPAEETVAVPKAQLDALLARVASLEAKTASSAPMSPEDREAALPDQSAVDPKTIKTPVLTKQGWVLPVGFGSNPAAARL